MSITKTTCERYSIRTERPGEWATIMISEEAGELNIQSDYGNWGNTWPNHGRASFKHFLCEISKSYLMAKLGATPDFDAAATVECVRRDMASYVEDAEIRKECLEELAELETYSADSFLDSFANTDTLSDLFEEPHHFLADKPNQQCTVFCENLWPPFIAFLKEEISNTPNSRIEKVLGK